MNKAFFIFSILLALGSPAIAQQNSFVSPAGTKYLVYTPPSYSIGTQNHPLLISLHGKGEMGDDINILTVNNLQQQPSRLIYLNRWSKDLPFIVLSPLYTPPANEVNPQWPAEYIDEVVRQVTANYRVDMNRIYVTGLSLGGTGTWTYAAAYPGKVAAILPISGRSDLTKACAVKNIPAWVFHGDNDPTVTLQYSIDMINAINSCKIYALYRRRLSVMNARGHSGWSEVYNGSNGNKIYEWLLKFSKNNTTNTSPYVNAGPDRTILVRPGSVHMYGDYFDSDGTITSVQWRQLSGPPLTLANINSEYFKLSNLQPGTCEFEFAVTDNNGATSTDRVILTLVSTSTLPVVNNLVLMNGATNTDIQNLSDGMVINKTQLGITQINIRADASATTNSVRYTVNADLHTRTISSPGPYYIKPQSTSSPEWEIRPGHYVICATAYANTGASGQAGLANCVKIKVVEEINIPGCEGYGKIQREIWPGIPGNNVSAIPLATTPAAKTDLFIFESPTDVWDNFGERIRGYVCPPVTGAYTFWISSNDDSELWLSTNATSANKQKIAFVSGNTLVRQWTKYPSQKSIPIVLSAGTKYYIEALHKEGIDSDHLAVGWQLPDGTFERPIPGIRLIPLGTSAADDNIDEVTALDEPSADRLVIFPNPITSRNQTLHVRGIEKRQGQGEIEIEITSIAGQRIFKERRPCDACTEQSILLDKHLTPGLYIVHITSGAAHTSRRLVVAE